jgi:nucleotide-binding universal stress UspA family protein
MVSVTSNQVNFLGELPADDELNSQILRILENAAAKVQIPGATIQTRAVSESSVGQGLVQFAEDSHCDLIVLGESPKGFIDRMLLGSVSRYVLRHAHCSIWIARNKATVNTSKES